MLSLYPISVFSANVYFFFQTFKGFTSFSKMFHQVLRLRIDRGKVPSERMMAYVGMLSLLLLSTASGSHPLSLFFPISLLSQKIHVVLFSCNTDVLQHTRDTRTYCQYAYIHNVYVCVYVAASAAHSSLLADCASVRVIHFPNYQHQINVCLCNARCP